MKLHQRLDYDRLAEVLGDRGLVEPSALQHVLHQCISSGQLFPEVLVAENLISDWELARVACETFNLAFLPVEIYSPSLNASTDLDVSFLHRHGLVPLDRFGKQLTVAMPIIVPAKILTGLEREHGVEVVPVIGCVGSNRLWLQKNLTLKATANTAESVDGALPSESTDPWAGIFDAGDAAVLLELEGGEESDDFAIDGLEALSDTSSGTETAGESIEPPSIIAPPAVEPTFESSSNDSDDESSVSIDLPEIS